MFTKRSHRVRTTVALFAFGVPGLLFVADTVTRAQLSSSPSILCHATDGAFTVCSDGAQEWSDVPARFSAETKTYLYADQADLDPVLAGPQSPADTFLLMYDECARTVPLGPNEYFLVSFKTVETEEGKEKIEQYVLHLFTDGTLAFFEDGILQPPGRAPLVHAMRGAVGFGPSPNCPTPHVTAEFQIPLSIAGGGSYSPDPLFWSSIIPRRRNAVALFTGFSGANDSSGMEELRQLLLQNPDNILDVRRFAHSQQNAALAFLRSHADDADLVLIGHSWGADSTIEVAERLNNEGLSVEKLVQIDSIGFGDDLLPPNVRTGLNYFQTGDSLNGENPVGGSTNVDAETHLGLTPQQLAHTTIDNNSAIQTEIVNFKLNDTLPSGDGVTPPASPTRSVSVLGPLPISGSGGLVSSTQWDSGVIQLSAPLTLTDRDGALIDIDFTDPVVMKMTDMSSVSSESLRIELFGSVITAEIPGGSDDNIEVEFQFDDAAEEFRSAQVADSVSISGSLGVGVLVQSVNLTDSNVHFGGFTLQLLQNSIGLTQVTGLRVVLGADVIVVEPAPPASQGLNILVYGPASGAGILASKASSFGHQITVFNAAQWAAAPTAMFAQFDVIAIPTLLSTSQAATLAATRDTWGAAITGNIVISGLHADEHSNVGARQYLENGLAFAGSSGATGFLSLVDCSTNPAYSWVPQRGPFVGLSAQGCTATDTITITDSTHPVMKTPNLLTNALLSNWSQSLHTFFPTVGGFNVVATGSGGGTPAGSAAALVSQGAEQTDVDEDGIAADLDNCPVIANETQEDTNLNGIGNACENPNLLLSTAAFLQAGLDATTEGETTPPSIGAEPSLADQLGRIVEFRVSAGLSDAPAALTANLVESLVDVGVVPPEAAAALVSDVLQQFDNTPPFITLLLSEVSNAAGWHNRAVTVTWNVSDPESGIASSTGCAPITIGAETPGTGVTCTATNGATLSASASVTIKLDLTAPSVACGVHQNTLWPPNHKLVQVNATVTVSDSLSGPAAFALQSVTSSEPDDSLGDGDTTNDIQDFLPGTADVSGLLRAERSGRGSGRIYSLVYRGKDQAGNVAQCDARVSAPHNR